MCASPPQPRRPAASAVIAPPDDWVRAVREAQGMTVTELAGVLDIPAWRLAQWERDRRLPRGRKMRAVLNDFARCAGLPTR